MSALSIQPAYPIFTDIDGQPLEDGYVWIGTANLDPQTNPINVYWDAALTLPAAQPIRTLAGYPANSGTPARLYVNSDYSIRVMNKNGSVVYSAPAATERYSGTVITNIDSSQVNFLQSGSGAVAISLQNRTRQSVEVSVFDFMTPAQIASVQAQDMVEDVTTAIQNAITALGGTYDILSAYQFVPARVLRFPPGTYKITSTINVGVNNIVIQGSGWYNTTIKCADTVQIIEVLRIQGAYTGELNDINIDGGLPFSPTGTETYGADIGVTFDQVALFSSRNLNITNTRYEGKRCIHLWECYFENLRIFNTGFFGYGGGTYRSAGIRFTALGKQNNTFPGGESNNVTYNKVAFGVTGTYVSMDEVPCFNMYFNDVIAEGRTWSVAYPSTGETKWRLGGTSQNIAVDNAYTFAHAQPFPCNATLIDIGTVNCKFKNYRVYSYKDNTYLEVTNLINATEYAEIDLSFKEELSTSVTLIGSTAPFATLKVSLQYENPAARSRASLFGANCENKLIGTLSMLTNGVVENYTYYANASNLLRLSGETFVRPFYPCMFWASYNGVGNVLRGSGGLTVTKNGTGDYTFTFDTPMFDTGYSVVCNGDTYGFIRVPSQTVNGFQVTCVNTSSVAQDLDILNVSVFR